MFKADIRAGVINLACEQTDLFTSWCQTALTGSCVLKHDADGVHVWFDEEEDFISYTLTWCEPWPSPQVIIPLLRRVMPTIIAKDILRVSPMCAPSLNLQRILNSRVNK